MAVAPVVWIIDSDHWPRAMLRAELLERGFDAVGFETVDDAIFALPTRPPNGIVVDVKGQPMPQVEKLLKIGVPVIVVAGALESADLPQAKWEAVLRRPVSVGEIARTVEQSVLPRRA